MGFYEVGALFPYVRNSVGLLGRIITLWELFTVACDCVASGKKDSVNQAAIYTLLGIEYVCNPSLFF